MPEITLKTGKKITTKELGAYQSYKINSFLEGSIDPEEAAQGQMPASVAFQMATLKALFRVDTVDGKKVPPISKRKDLVVAFSHFSNDDEMNDYVNQLNEADAKENETEGK